MRPSLLTALTISSGMLVFAISDNFIWLVAEEMSVWQYHAVRAAMMLPFMALVMLVLGQARSLRVVRPGAVALRAVFVVMALMCYFAAIPAVGINLAAAGLFTSPVFVLLISVLFFGESVGWRRILGVALGLVGVGLVLKIGTEPIRLMAVAPMIGGAFYAMGVIWTRQFCQQESAGALAFWNMTGFLVIAGAGILLTPWIAGLIGHFEGTGFATMPVQVLSWTELGIVALMGVAGATGMVFLAIGYRASPSSYAALFDFSFLFWVPLFAWLLRNETPGLSVAGGMALIVFAGWLALSDPARRDADA
jgi:drug/metabolite transporter (DMT)-like permease